MDLKHIKQGLLRTDLNFSKAKKREPKGTRFFYVKYRLINNKSYVALYKRASQDE